MIDALAVVPPHVEGQQILDAQLSAQVVGAHDPSGRARFDAVRGALPHHAGSGHAAVRLHDHEGSLDARSTQAIHELLQVLFDHRPHVAVDDSGAGTLVLLDERQELARER